MNNHHNCSQCQGQPECVCDDTKNHDCTPTKCPSCGGDWFSENVTGYVEHVIAEFEVSCVWCHEDIAFWAYGYYQPPVK